MDRPPDPSAAFPSLDHLAPGIPPVSWLWPGWIPRGMITLLCAAPGAGKSYFALDLAHRLIAGLPWPDGAPPAQPGAPGANVIYVDAEAAPQLLNARAVAWGMDRSRLFPMLPAPDRVGRDGALDLNAPACQDRLLKMATALRPALIIVDSLGSASRGAENQASAVDDLFDFLNRLAVRHQAALLLIHHLRKRGAAAGGALPGASLSGEDVRGSGHIVSLARSVLGLTEVRDLAAVQIGLDPQQDAPRRLQLLKTNLGPYPNPLGITFVSSASGAADLAYGPAAEPMRPRTVVQSCASWLLYVLAACGRPMSPSELEYPANEAGYSRRTIFRARELLGSQVVDTHGRYHPRNHWALPASLSRTNHPERSDTKSKDERSDTKSKDERLPQQVDTKSKDCSRPPK